MSQCTHLFLRVAYKIKEKNKIVILFIVLQNTEQDEMTRKYTSKY